MVYEEKLLLENMRLEEVRTVADAVEKFSRSLYRVMKDTENGNFVFSPYGAPFRCVPVFLFPFGTMLEQHCRQVRISQECNLMMTSAIFLIYSPERSCGESY